MTSNENVGGTTRLSDLTLTRQRELPMLIEPDLVVVPIAWVHYREYRIRRPEHTKSRVGCRHSHSIELPGLLPELRRRECAHFYPRNEEFAEVLQVVNAEDKRQVPNNSNILAALQPISKW